MTARDFQKGQTVTFAQRQTGLSASGYGTSHVFSAGDTAEVTTVRRNTITVRIETTLYGTRGKYSFNVPREALNTPNGEVWVAPPAKPKPRPLGQKPEGDHIAVDDPRIAWIWKDAERAAGSYCHEYDRITNRLGIPGRLRDIRVDTTINGITITAHIKARSEKEAEALLKTKLTEAKA